MSVTNFPTVPAVYTSRSVLPRNIFKSGYGQFYPSGLATIDGTKSRDTTNSPITVLQAGLLMGKVTSGGKYANTSLGVTSALHDTSVATTTMTLPAAIVTELTRRVGTSGTFNFIGPATTAGQVNVETVTYSAIASGTTLTVTATVNDFVAGSIVAGTDGSQFPTQLVVDQYGVPVTDEFAASLDHTMRLLRGGDFDTTQIVGYSAMDASTKAWVKASLKTVMPAATFSDDR